MRICDVLPVVVVVVVVAAAAAERSQMGPIAEDTAGRVLEGPGDTGTVDLVTGMAVLGAEAEGFDHGIVELGSVGTGSGYKEEY